MAYNTFAYDNNVMALIKTPTFDVTKGPKASNGLKLIKIEASDWMSIMVLKD